MKLCELFKKTGIALLTVMGICLLGGCGSDEAGEADANIASAAVTDVIVVTKTETEASSETAEETVSETEIVTSSETTEETVSDTEIVTSSETTE